MCSFRIHRDVQTRTRHAPLYVTTLLLDTMVKLTELSIQSLVSRCHVMHGKVRVKVQETCHPFIIRFYFTRFDFERRNSGVIRLSRLLYCLCVYRTSNDEMYCNSNTGEKRAKDVVNAVDYCGKTFGRCTSINKDTTKEKRSLKIQNVKYETFRCGV